MNWTAAKDLTHLAKQKPALATLIVLVGLIAWATWAHNGGLAKADEMKALKEEFAELKVDVGELNADVKEGRLDTLEGQLFEARVNQCKADNEELRAVYAQRVGKLQSTYIELTDHPFSIPECKDI